MAITLLPATVTWGEAKKRVARVIGSPTNAEALLLAAEMLQTALEDLANERDWRWLQMTYSTTTDANGLLTLPTRCKKIYDLQCGGNTLIPCPRRYYNQARPQAESVGGAYFYIAFNTAETGKVQTIDPVASATATVGYVRMLDVPADVLKGTTSDASVLDVPEPYQNYVVALAKHLIASELEPESSALSTKWRAFAREGIAKAKMQDQYMQEEVVFIPSSLAGGWPLSLLQGPQEGQ